LANSLDLPPTLIHHVLEGIASQAAQELQHDGEFLLPGIGRIKVVERAARTSRNPRTGEAVAVPARKALKFKGAKELVGVLGKAQPE